MSNFSATSLKKHLGLKIKHFRKLKGLSQAQLAELVKLEIKSLSRIEAGHNYPLCENLTAISKVLGVEPWQLYYDDTDKNIEKMRKYIIQTVENNNSLIPSIYQYIKTLDL